MKLSDMPLLIDVPFAKNAAVGYVRPIPDTTVVAGAASYDLGFPPLTATPIGAGGIPPDIKDMNGILLALSEWTNWLNAGAPVTYDVVFATVTGGYPRDSVVLSTATPGKFWRSIVDDNTTDPDGVGAANWVPLITVDSMGPLSVGTGNLIANSVTNAKLANGPASTVKGRAATGATTDLTMSQLVGLLNAAGGIALASQSATFTAAGNGVWAKIGSILIQIGSVTNATLGPATFDYPVPFTSQVFGVFPVAEISVPTGADVANSRTRTLTNATINRLSNGSAGNFNFSYLAIGI